MGFWHFVRCTGRAVWREVTGKLQVWAQAMAGLTNLAVVVFIIVLVAEPRWQAAVQQLTILEVLGVIAALTNAVVVIALSRVNVSAKGPGGTQFDVDAGGSEAVAVAVAQAGPQ